MSSVKIAVTGEHGQLARSMKETATQRAGFLLCCSSRVELDFATAEDQAISSFLDQAAPDVVVSAAAYTNVDLAEEEQELAFQINGKVPRILAREANRRGIPIIHVSTDYVFDGKTTQAYRETDDVAPLNVYGASKLEGERAVRDEQPNHVILRTSWLYSPYGRNFVTTMLKLAEARSTIDVVADQTGTPTSAQSLAEAIFEIALRLVRSKDGKIRGTFHAAGSGETNWAQFARFIFKQSLAPRVQRTVVKEITTRDFQSKSSRPAYSSLDSGKLMERYGVRLPCWQDDVTKVIAAIQRDRNAARE
ncbi:dTDP-4-dehydrorhamnose reductase [Rhizobium sp. YIM 134829]|uniref:dTDP-4-dehydrorhamnose reductase n=1 Tax=Rhizobium sp. YIM 134829 TaxID=3390453 RepID=UPI0039781054